MILPWLLKRRELRRPSETPFFALGVRWAGGFFIVMLLGGGTLYFERGPGSLLSLSPAAGNKSRCHPPNACPPKRIPSRASTQQTHITPRPQEVKEGLPHHTPPAMETFKNGYPNI